MLIGFRPNVQKYRQERDVRQSKADEYAAGKENEAPAKSGAEEKAELMARAQPSKEKPTHLKGGADRRVKVRCGPRDRR